jgi:bifunctional DNA-binding transcriptional regulator/antitoxin component of YhaV-PrlF toxin-antitoxin module
MPLHVAMDEGGVVTLPPDLIERLGWRSDTVLKLTITPAGDLSTKPADTSIPEGSDD